MTLSFIKTLILKVDQKRQGCKVEMTAIDVPPHGAELYGVVTIGMKDYRRVFHGEGELVEILTQAAR